MQDHKAVQHLKVMAPTLVTLTPSNNMVSKISMPIARTGLALELLVTISGGS
jgi:hypothetical protein